MRTDPVRAHRCLCPANNARALHVTSVRQSCWWSPHSRVWPAFRQARTPARPGLPSSQDASHQTSRAQQGGQRAGSHQGHGMCPGEGGSGGGCAQGHRGSKAGRPAGRHSLECSVQSPGTHTAWTAPQGPLGFWVGVHLSVGGAARSLRGPGSRPAHSSRDHQGDGATVGPCMPEPGHHNPASQEQKQE